MNDITYAGGQVVSNGREIGSRLLYYERPFTAAALGGVLGIALINTLRGK